MVNPMPDNVEYARLLQFQTGVDLIMVMVDM